MRIPFTLMLALISVSLLFTSCQKDALENSAANSTVTAPVKPDTIAAVVPVIYKRTITVGTGSGNLTIDGTTLGLQCSDLIKIKGGTYTGITVKSILSADGCPITIKNDGLVEIAGDFSQMTLTDIKNLTISGDGTTGIAKGLVFRDNKYRAVQISGSLNQFILQNVAFKNIGDISISFQDNKVYDGTPASYSADIKLLNISSVNTSSLFATSGGVSNGNITGLIKNIEIANIDFENAPGVGSVVYMGNVENYDIHNNRVNNINTTNNNHNGIFMMCGNGKFYNNYVSNHQGNAIRAWGHTVGSTPKQVLIYNNIVVNSRKYSGFEVQSYAFNITAGKTTYVNAIVFNNTCGNLNTSNDWQGNVVDVYSLQGGKAEVYNNLGFNFQTGSGIAGQEAELIPVASNNQYYSSSSAAGLVDQTNFRLTSNSPAKRAGKTEPFLITDYYGSARSVVPSIGAVE